MKGQKSEKSELFRNPSLKAYLWIFLWQSLASLFAIIVFVMKIFDSRYLASVAAGLSFLALGFGQIWLTRNWSDRWRRPSIYSYWVYLFGFTLPIFATRMLSDKDFYQVKIFGLSGPQFHKLSEVAFLVMVFLTLVDAGLQWRRDRAKQA